MRDNQIKWIMAMMDEQIMLLDIVIILLARDYVFVQILFALKTLGDFATTIIKASKVKRDDDRKSAGM